MYTYFLQWPQGRERTMQSPDDEAVSVTIYLSGLHREVEPVEITLMAVGSRRPVRVPICGFPIQHRELCMFQYQSCDKRGNIFPSVLCDRSHSVGSYTAQETRFLTAVVPQIFTKPDR